MKVRRPSSLHLMKWAVYSSVLIISIHPAGDWLLKVFLLPCSFPYSLETKANGRRRSSSLHISWHRKACRQRRSWQALRKVAAIKERNEGVGVRRNQRSSTQVAEVFKCCLPTASITLFHFQSARLPSFFKKVVSLPRYNMLPPLTSNHILWQWGKDGSEHNRGEGKGATPLPLQETRLASPYSGYLYMYTDYSGSHQLRTQATAESPFFPTTLSNAPTQHQHITT